MRVGSSWYYLFGDHLGSTAITANSSGAKIAEVRYAPWGTDRYTSGTTPTTYRFTGQRFEASFGLYFYNARWYDPALGRFAQADTFVPEEVQGLDRYAYTANNPLKYVDPSGHDVCDEEGNCYERGRFYKHIKTGPTHPEEFFLKQIYRSPVHDPEQNNPHGFGQNRGEYCYNGTCTGNVIFHPGVDIGNKTDVDIYAVAPGLIVFAGKTIDLGFPVIIEHDVFGTKFYSIYGHLGTKESSIDEAILMKEGKVSYDIHIGEMGKTKGTGEIDPHLHLEIRTSTNINLANEGNPLRDRQWWIFKNGVQNSYTFCSQWQQCFLDLGKLYGYDETFDH